MTATTVYFSVIAEPAGDPSSRRARSSALARSLLSRMLAAVCNLAPADIRISVEPSGKPFLEPAGGRPLPFISLAHTQGWIACAATAIGPLGIDIEWHRRGRDHAGIARAAFGRLEQERARASTPAFYRIWTLREAVAKATGAGLKLAADRRDRVHDGPDDGSWRARLDEAYWHLSHHRLREDLSLATAVMLEDSSQAVEIQRW
ncbi:MAG TPA: 4'-phosphopantetheinyl transferase superfamily protein, partial [Xanthobacteraceae bacterium]